MPIRIIKNARLILHLAKEFFIVSHYSLLNVYGIITTNSRKPGVFQTLWWSINRYTLKIYINYINLHSHNLRSLRGVLVLSPLSNTKHLSLSSFEQSITKSDYKGHRTNLTHWSLQSSNIHTLSSYIPNPNFFQCT